MIPQIVGVLEFVLLLFLVTFTLRILAIVTILVLTTIHPERRGWYMKLFNIKQNDL